MLWFGNFVPPLFLGLLVAISVDYIYMTSNGSIFLFLLICLLVLISAHLRLLKKSWVPISASSRRRLWRQRLARGSVHLRRRCNYHDGWVISMPVSKSLVMIEKTQLLTYIIGLHGGCCQKYFSIVSHDHKINHHPLSRIQHMIWTIRNPNPYSIQFVSFFTFHSGDYEFDPVLLVFAVGNCWHYGKSNECIYMLRTTCCLCHLLHQQFVITINTLIFA